MPRNQLIAAAGMCAGREPDHHRLLEFSFLFHGRSILTMFEIYAGFQHIRMYDLNSNNPNPVVNYEGVSKNVTAVGFQEDGKWMFTGGEDGTAKIWDLRSRNLQVFIRKLHDKLYNYGRMLFVEVKHFSVCVPGSKDIRMFCACHLCCAAP
jgi:WD40 repeat protein